MRPGTSRRRAPPRRTATSVAHAAPAFPEPSRSPRWITRVAVIIPGPNPRQNGHWNTGFGPLRRGATAGKVSRRPAPPSSSLFPLVCPICFGRPRLDHIHSRSEPPDGDPTAEILPYPFGLSLLLKSPRLSLKSSRSPLMFRNNYSSAHIFARTPLSFLEFKPAIQTYPFHELNPRTNL